MRGRAPPRAPGRLRAPTSPRPGTMPSGARAAESCARRCRGRPPNTRCPAQAARTRPRAPNRAVCGTRRSDVGARPGALTSTNGARAGRAPRARGRAPPRCRQGTGSTPPDRSARPPLPSRSVRMRLMRTIARHRRSRLAERLSLHALPSPLDAGIVIG